MDDRISVKKRAGLTRAEAVAVARKRIKDGTTYLISRHGGWFRPGAQGYARHLSEAGLFSADEARGYIDVDGLSVIPAGAILTWIDWEIADLEKRLASAKELRTRIAGSEGQQAQGGDIARDLAEEAVGLLKQATDTSLSPGTAWELFAFAVQAKARASGLLPKREDGNG
ncbi:hypothetical protein [Azospirillum argentinense]|uniref:Uncharacterized protein n=1 Tax=Azospirillum argentinense TaxID=2970906 RepID=A0A5B0KYV7_9PROT|nr:hypothetical protein [Azospirillum argentinense]KAA1057205.1 hypothetical protein FH063_001373 [Azospirillum argentinense]